MEKTMTGKCSHQLWLVILVFFVFCFVLFCFDYSNMLGANDEVVLFVNEEQNPLLVAGNTTNSTVLGANDGVVLPVNEEQKPLVVAGNTTNSTLLGANDGAVSPVNEEQNPILVAGNTTNSTFLGANDGAVSPANEEQNPLLVAGNPTNSTVLGANDGAVSPANEEQNPLVIPDTTTTTNQSTNTTDRTVETKSDMDSCLGRYIYVHDLPSRFNNDFLKNCERLTRGTNFNMCPYLENSGLGPEIENSQGFFPNRSWFNTNQFLVEVIFHNKMKRYKCLTNDSSVASAIFVPFYAGLDASLYLWNPNISFRDSSGKDLLKWLVEKQEWKKMWGRDHFLIAGRISWDFRRMTDESTDWGSKFRFLPESQNMSMLSVEASSWKNDFAIPYPTNFHPSKDIEISEWQTRVRSQNRSHLFTFAGAPRPELDGSIRGVLIDQCRGSNFCKFIDCGSSGGNKCDDPASVMRVFQSSVYCLQPGGDSYTRKSIFDSILAGCIPVFFHPGAAYAQYLWHLPKNGTDYSVYIPIRNVTDWKGNVEKVLLGISKDKESAMREEVIRLIPNTVYADPRSRLETFEDAFDLSVKGVLDRIERVREVIREGKDPAVGFAEGDDYKYTFTHWEYLENLE